MKGNGSAKGERKEIKMFLFYVYAKIESLPRPNSLTVHQSRASFTFLVCELVNDMHLMEKEEGLIFAATVDKA